MKNRTLDVARPIFAWTQALFFTLLFSNLVWLPYALAEPQGGTVTGGSGEIHLNGNQTTIHQNSQNMSINWQSYNLGSDERVQYIQPNRSSISLNRILDNNGTVIQGRIDSNGQIILINPNGIFFTSTANINVGGIIASGLDMTPTDFMNGNYIFREVQGTDGIVVNSGMIRASTGGNVTLLGKNVINNGLIEAKLGAVNMGAGKEAVLTFDNRGLIGVGITKAVLQDELGIDPAVLNNGSIIAEGGRVLLTASVSKDIFSQLINIDRIRATSVVVNDDGTFTLGGGANVVNTGTITVAKNSISTAASDVARIVLIGENVTNSGTLNADNANGDGGMIELHARDTTLLTENSITSARSEANGQGGIIKILGDKVGLFDQATVDVSGANGGGTALIGGDYQGKNTDIRNASMTYVGAESVIRADALDSGDGGRIIVWADDTTRFNGGLFAQGGINGGDGGFAEVSGKQRLDFQGRADLSAIMGESGTILFDPLNITIRNAGRNETPADVGQNDAFNENATDNVFFTPEQIQDLLVLSSVELQANENITVEEEISMASGNTNNLTLRANDTITIDATGDHNGAIDLGSGDIILVAGSNGCGTAPPCAGDGFRNIMLNGTLDTFGSISLTAADDILVNQAIGSNSAASDITLQAGDDITINASLTSINSLESNGNINLTAGYSDPDDIVVNPNLAPNPTRDVEINDAIDSGGGNITLNATNQITVRDTINTAGTATRAGNFIAISATFDNNDNNAQIKTAIDSSSNVVAGNVTITATGNVDLGAIVTVNEDSGGVSIGGDLSVTSTGGTIVQGDGASNDTDRQARLFNISGNANFIASNGTIHNTINLQLFHDNGDYGNQFDGTVSFIGQNVTIYADSAIDLSNAADTSTAAGTLFVRSTGPDGSNGDITQSGVINVTGLTTLVADGNDITLDNDSNAFSTVMFDGARNVNLHDIDSIMLAASDITGTLDVVANGTGSIGQSGTLVVAGNTTLSAGNNITLADPDNDFNNVNIITANTVTLVDSVGYIGLSGSVDTNLIVTATGSEDGGNVITNPAGLSVGGTTTLTINDGESIYLGNVNNNFTGIMSFLSTGTIDNLNVYDNSALTTQDGLTIGGDLTIHGNQLTFGDLGNTFIGGDLIATTSATGSIAQSAGYITVGRSSSFTSGTGGIELISSNNFTGAVSLNTTSSDATIRDIDSLTLGASNVDGILDVDVLMGDLDQIGGTDNGITVTGDAVFTLAAGQTVTLDNTDNNFSSVYIAANRPRLQLQDVTISNSTNLDLQGINLAGDLTVTTTDASITDSDDMIVGGLTILNSGTGTIRLDNTGNDFTDLTVNASGTAYVYDANTVNLVGTSTVSNLTLEAGLDITDAIDARVDATGGVARFITGQDVILDSGLHTISTLRLNSIGDSTVYSASNVDMGSSSVGGNLIIESDGDISNTVGALDITGTASFSVMDGGSISLINAGNHFAQVVSLSSSGSTLNNVAIHNSVATEINVGDRITGDLDIDSLGAITSSSALLVDGTTTLSANGQNITLINAANDFNIINVDAANRVDIRDANSIAIGSINATTTILTALNGQITDSNDSDMNIVGDTASLNATDGVGADDPLETRLTNLTISNTTGGIGINNTGNVTVNMATSGDIDFTNTGDVYIDLLDGVANGDTHSQMQLTVINGSVFGAEPQTLPDIRGHDVTVIVNDGAGDFGTAGRPIYLDVHGVFTLLANISSYDFSGDVPSDIVDNSSIQLSISSLFSLLSSQKLVEVESLFDLDPAIFTEVRNYYHDELAIMMPLDQMYSEEEEQRRNMSER